MSPWPVNARPVMDRLVDRLVFDANGCWLWTGSKSYGYGKIGVGSRTDGTNAMTQCHRVSYEHFRGPIPEGLTLDHLCRVRHCANPWHLEPVSVGENVRRGEAANIVSSRTNLCKRGHSLEGAYITKRGSRQCRECQRERDRQFKSRRRAAKQSEGKAL